MSKVNITLFSQVLALIDRNLFQRIVQKYDSDKHSKGINSWTHLVAMLFMHMANAHSLRDISNGLRSATGDLNHMGVMRAPSKSSMSYINAHRSYKIFEQLYYDLMERFIPSLRERRRFARRLKRKVLIMDSSLIRLTLSVFNWAKYRTTKGAVKLHAVLDYDVGLPTYACISDGKKVDIKVARTTVFPSESVLVIDKAYADFEWYNNLDSNSIFFVSRLKCNVQYEEVESMPTNEKHKHILSDQKIRLTGYYVSKKYPKNLRLVRVYDEKNDMNLELLTNNMFWTADTISQLYQARWDIEVFFRNLKQTFKVKSFVGTNPNAVRIQMWTAMIAMLLYDYLKKKAEYKWHLSNLVSFMRFNLFVKVNLWQWINEPVIIRPNPPPQGTLFPN